jgi:ubiquinone/menaquinone biosynthesis C-methylase UbiE
MPLDHKALKDSARKKKIRDFMDRNVLDSEKWMTRNHYYYEAHEKYMRFLVPEGQRVLDLGCGTGSLLNALQPSYGVGIDLSEQSVNLARKKFPELEFSVGDIEDEVVIENLSGPFDYIILSDTIGHLTDCQATLELLHRLCTPETRLIVSYFSWKWEPILRFFEKLNLKMKQIEMNWMSTEDIKGLLCLADFEPIKREWRLLLPKRLLGIGSFVNKYLGPLPLIRHANLRNYVIARSLRDIRRTNPSTTVLIPCRNEEGNIENAVRRIPRFCDELEILFVEGNSQDNTVAEIRRVINKYPEKDIKILVQDGVGKGDAVRKGFSKARGEILMILDADLTVPPEDLPKFYDVIASGKGEYINGSRLIYPMEKESMRFLNYWANSIFAAIFSWLLNQRFTDTLCGTKVISRKNYKKIAANRAYFGDFDPFGDFDLIFGASKLNLKIVEVPIRYAAREYGETQISRFRHGLQLLRMVWFAFRKMKCF